MITDIHRGTGVLFRIRQNSIHDVLLAIELIEHAIKTSC